MNFSKSNIKKKVKLSNNRAAEVQLQRDIFGQMLGIAIADAQNIIEKKEKI